MFVGTGPVVVDYEYYDFNMGCLANVMNNIRYNEEGIAKSPVKNRPKKGCWIGHR